MTKTTDDLVAAQLHLTDHGADETALAALLHLSHDAIRRAASSTSADLSALHKLANDCALAYANAVGMSPGNVNAAYQSLELLRIATSTDDDSAQQETRFVQ